MDEPSTSTPLISAAEAGALADAPVGALAEALAAELAEAPAPGGDGGGGGRPPLLRTVSNATIGSDDPSFFGGKTIGTFGAVVLVANNVVGPGMLELPKLFQEAGWLPTTLACVAVASLSATAACFFCDAFALLPGNAGFARRAEFNAPFKHHFGPAVDALVHGAYFLTIQARARERENVPRERSISVENVPSLSLTARARSTLPRATIRSARTSRASCRPRR